MGIIRQQPKQEIGVNEATKLIDMIDQLAYYAWNVGKDSPHDKGLGYVSDELNDVKRYMVTFFRKHTPTLWGNEWCWWCGKEIPTGKRDLPYCSTKCGKADVDDWKSP